MGLMEIVKFTEARLYIAIKWQPLWCMCAADKMYRGGEEMLN